MGTKDGERTGAQGTGFEKDGERGGMRERGEEWRFKGLLH